LRFKRLQLADRVPNATLQRRLCSVDVQTLSMLAIAKVFLALKLVKSLVLMF
jgi:hypothetical protein